MSAQRLASVSLVDTPSREISDPAVLAKAPLVSVWMTTYNHEPYIARAIEGVLMQETTFPIELVIGEDCSTDRTREIVMEYQKRRPDIIQIGRAHV
jgi:glycosyltransferase involved in cell wall biosynthesis